VSTPESRGDVEYDRIAKNRTVGVVDGGTATVGASVVLAFVASPKCEFEGAAAAQAVSEVVEGERGLE
jgi:hypothetical protein